ncbi:MAG: L-aspartate oxidase [Planctomycetota bacterium]|jgi:L-aspartate oxidase
MLERFDQRRYLIPFRSLLLPHIFTDTLVIGAGVAGMRTSIAAAEHGDVILLAKGPLDLSSTAWAQGGLASVRRAEDSVEAHVEDTLDAGAGLCDIAATRILVEETPERVEELIQWGMRFDRDEAGEIDCGREGGHRQRRILHSGGAATGSELTRCLREVVAAQEGIRVFESCLALDVLTANTNDGRGDGRVLGAITWHRQHGLQIIWAKATVLATGGAGQVYRETTNPRVATGDGLAMGYRAGALVGDVEFMQFHPTTLYVAGSARSLISEAVRGEGAWLVDRDGRRFMETYHEMGELAPRDVVSRAILDHLARTGDTHVFLDARQFESGAFARRFPALTTALADFEIDPARDLIPVHPSAHYTIGGLWTDTDGRTSLPGLYACGEVACLGMHGANRLASNSLTEGLVFGRRAGLAAAEMNNRQAAPRQIVSDIRVDEHGELDLVDVSSSLRSAMWRNVGIERNGTRLADVIDMFNFWARYTLDVIFDEPAGWETQNLLTVGVLITRAAAWRCESRGVHFRTDFPDADDALRRHALWRTGCDEPALRPVESATEAVS